MFLFVYYFFFFFFFECLQHSLPAYSKFLYLYKESRSLNIVINYVKIQIRNFLGVSIVR
jgi:hypothetical protein